MGKNGKCKGTPQAKGMTTSCFQNVFLIAAKESRDDR